MKYKVMIVEDQTMPRELFELRVQASERFELTLSIDNAALADVYCLRFPVDLILMDVITRDGENGLDAAARIKRAFPQIKIIIVTSMPECSYLKRAKEIGVESFWYKEEQRESLLDVMERTMNGESVYPGASPELTLGMASSYQFTERELDILREITSGDTNQEIADRLNMSVATVKTHILNMLEKTGFRNRTELAVRARESGLVILNRRILIRLISGDSQCENSDNGRAMRAPTTLRKNATVHCTAAPVGARIARPLFVGNLLFAYLLLEKKAQALPI